MEKQKKNYILGFIALLLVFVANIILFATHIFKLWLFLVIFATTIALGVFMLYRFLKVLKKIKSLNEVKEPQSTGDYNIDLYGVLGIPFQYNPDGSVKNIFELLGIEPVYDENGNRVLTVYELLKMMPKFDKNGNEIPLVFSVKNRVGRIAKVDLNSRVLTRKLSEEEKEYLAIKEALEKKMQEAEQNGNKPMQEAIKKIIDKNDDKKKKAKEEKKKDGESAPKYKINKPSGIPKPPAAPKKNIVVIDYFKFAEKSSKAKEEKKGGSGAVDKKTGEKKTGTAETKQTGTVETGKTQNEDKEKQKDAASLFKVLISSGEVENKSSNEDSERSM